MFKKADLLAIFTLRPIKILEFYLWDPEAIVNCSSFLIRYPPTNRLAPMD